MADIAGVKILKEVLWEQINHDDDGEAVLVDGGEYQVECQGDWTGSMQIAIQQSTIDAASVKDIDTTNPCFTANGSYGVKLARGCVKPTRTNGSYGADVDIKMTAIPRG